MLRHSIHHAPLPDPRVFPTPYPPIAPSILSALQSTPMTFRQELSSWTSWTSSPTSPPPKIGSPAPSIPGKLDLPSSTKNSTILAFLRHCGCPFAEKTFRSLRSTAQQHPDIAFIAISHSSQSATDRWLEALGGAGPVTVIVDAEREVYARWGLGASGWWHVLSPGAMWSVVKLGREEGIWNRPTESGSRWQSAGSWGVDGKGIVRWGRVAVRADEIADFGDGARALEELEKAQEEELLG